MVARLWQRLTELNNGFASLYGTAQVDDKYTSAFETWCVCLKDLTSDQFKAGLEKYERSGSSFIDAVNFYRLAGGVLHGANGGHVPRPFVRLPDNRTAEERCATAKPWIAKIRKDLARTKA